MKLNLLINGSLSLIILDSVNKKAVSKDIERSVFNQLQQGTLIIVLREKTICNINELNKPLFYFDFEVNDDTEYEFEMI